MPKNLPFRSLLLSLLATLSISASSLFVQGCGGHSSKPLSTTPLTAEEALVYEHGADFIAKLGGLEGRWRDEWDRDLNTRLATADAVLVVTIKTVRTDTDPEQRTTHRLVASIDRVIYGDPRGKEVELSVRQGVAGFMSVNDAITRFQDQTFVAYIKWFKSDTGSAAAHWHLSPASPEVVGETEARLASRKEGDETKGAVVLKRSN